MYAVAYYIVFAMRIESTMVKCKQIQILCYCFTLQCMIYHIDRHVLRLTCIDINVFIIYL